MCPQRDQLHAASGHIVIVDIIIRIIVLLPYVTLLPLLCLLFSKSGDHYISYSSFLASSPIESYAI